MRSFAVVLAAFVVSAVASNVAAQDRVRVGVVEDRSGFNSQRGARISSIYERYINQINRGGGVRSNSGDRRIDLIIKDSASNPTVAANAAAEVIERDRAHVVLCSWQTCLHIASRRNIPVIFTGGGFKITGDRSRGVFAINAPSADDAELQAELAIRATVEAIRDARELSADSIDTAFRNLAFTSDFGSVRFDNVGNNVGQVTYRIGPTSRPDAAGCSRSCASSCPTQCGQNKCTKDGSNECCDICGMPPQPGWRRIP